MTFYAYPTQQNYQDKSVVKITCYDYDKSNNSTIQFNYFRITKNELGYILFGSADKIDPLKDSKEVFKQNNLIIFQLHDKSYPDVNWKTKETKERSADKIELAICKYIEQCLTDKINRVLYGSVTLGSSSMVDRFIMDSNNETYKECFESDHFKVFTHEDQSLLSDDLNLEIGNQKSNFNSANRPFVTEYQKLKDKEKFICEVISSASGVNYSSLGDIYSLMNSEDEGSVELTILSELKSILQ